MIQHHIRGNATTFQIPILSSINHKSRCIPIFQPNKENLNSIRNNKTQPTIAKLEELPFLNTKKDNLNNNNFSNIHTQRNKLFLSKNTENQNNNSLNWSNFEYKKSFSKKIEENYQRKKFSQAVKPSKFPVDDRNILSIRIESNWEDTRKIMIYFIALFDKNNHQINSKNKELKDFIYISSFPESSSLIKLEHLLDSSYIEDDQSNFFCEFFGDQKFTIYLSIPQSIEIGSVLIFNPPIKSKSAIKDVSILMNEKLCIRSQIPQDFGLSLKLVNIIFFNHDNNQNSKDSSPKKQCPIPMTIAYQDNYGILPIKPIGKIRIEILETYNGKIRLIQDKENEIVNTKYCNENYVGVNGFDFYDILGNLILNQSNKPSENCSYFIKKVKIRGVSELIQNGMILKEDKQTNNKEKMFLGLMDHKQYPSFNFVFNRPIYLSKISIWNYNAFGSSVICGIKKLKVYADDKLIWFGKMACGNGKNKDCCFHSIKLFEPNPNITEIKI